MILVFTNYYLHTGYYLISPLSIQTHDFAKQRETIAISPCTSNNTPTKKHENHIEKTNDENKNKKDRKKTKSNDRHIHTHT